MTRGTGPVSPESAESPEITGPGGQWRLLTHCSAPVFPPPDPADTDGRPV